MSTTTQHPKLVTNLNASLQEAIDQGKALILTVSQYGYMKLTTQDTVPA